MDETQRREELPEHETRREEDGNASATADYAALSDDEATAIDEAAVDPHDISIDPDDADGNNEAPPISRSG